MFVPLPRNAETFSDRERGLVSSFSPPRKQLRNARYSSISWQESEAVTAPYDMFCNEETAGNFQNGSLTEKYRTLAPPPQELLRGGKPGTNSLSSLEPESEYRSLLVTQLPAFLDTETLKLRIQELFTKEIPKLLQETPYLCGPVAGPPTKEEAVRPGSRQQSVIHPRHLVNAEAFDLPFSICDIRVAKPTKSGHSSYAVIDFASAKLMQTALAFFGTTPVLPGTSHHIRFSPHTTWAAPVPVDQYHLYIAGLGPEATDEDVLELLKALGTEIPRSIKVVKDAKCRNNKSLGFAFLRFTSVEVALRALKIIQTRGAAYGLLGRRVYVSPSHKQVTQSCNGSIFLANVPPDATKEELRTLFSYFGDLRSVVTHSFKRIAFLEFSSHESALAAITHMQGYMLRCHSLACAWSVRRHTTYQEEGIEEDDGYRQAEEVCFSPPPP
ncbi:RNA recognition motif-containing protein [Toxoplasma gondii RUB]|uniref:RNA recognition motif-containing protein n=1 Tax=Toxoplasma gondii RUB TaxID=935652 RepID=A0A086M5B3_TOXGO|nr:RNA recognition motif-containing protein [Toxoplasma gondii RUB]